MTLERSKFQPYLKDRLICHRNENYCVIIPTEEIHIVPISCEICDFVMRTREDEISWHKFQCCERCSMYWAIPRIDDWKNGWRPSEEQIKKEIDSRPPVVVDINME